MRIALLFAFLVLTLVSPVWGQEPTHGGEIEFTSPEIIRDWATQPKVKTLSGVPYDGREGDLQRRFLRAIRSKCPVCLLLEESKRDPRTQKIIPTVNPLGNPVVQVLFPDGFYLIVDTDPACIEIKFHPLTLDELYENRKRLKQMIFDTASEVGLVVNRRDGSGHYNAGVISSFDGDPRKLLSYMADYSNFPELSLGALGHNLETAPPLAALRADQRKNFAEIVEVLGLNKETTLEAAQLVNMIYRDVYFRSRDADRIGEHDQALNIDSMHKEFGVPENEWRLEHRATFPQENIDQFILRAELFELRLRYLRRIGFPLQYNFKARENLRPTQVQTVNAFSRYIQEAGGNPMMFKDLLRPPLQKHLMGCDPILR